jgi:hypothetical protein
LHDRHVVLDGEVGEAGNVTTLENLLGLRQGFVDERGLREKIIYESSHNYIELFLRCPLAKPGRLV